MALLVLEDGRTFRGEAFGAVGETVGEAVFATGMTGYQETLTDPSYHRQVVVMTAPHVGNTGINDEDAESSRVQVAGYVVRDPTLVPSSWRSRRSLPDELARAGVAEHQLAVLARAAAARRADARPSSRLVKIACNWTWPRWRPSLPPCSGACCGR